MDRPKQFNFSTLVKCAHFWIFDPGTKPFQVLNNTLNRASHCRAAIDQWFAMKMINVDGRYGSPVFWRTRWFCGSRRSIRKKSSELSTGGSHRGQQLSTSQPASV